MSVTTQPAPTGALTIPAKLDLWEQETSGTVFEKSAEIETAVTSFVAANHHVQVGPPGIAKTYLVEQLHKYIDMQGYGYFRWLMTRFSVPEELFGPVSVMAMKQDHYSRNTTGKLPEAVLAFLDECFKANSAILNALLTLMNEGKFFNNGSVPMEARPLIFGGSNEIPKDAELAALWDRFTFRHLVKPMQNNDSKLAMLQGRAMRAHKLAAPDTIITWGEILQAQQASKLVEVPLVVHQALLDLWVKLEREGIVPTPRRFNDCIDTIQATAYRSGRSVADIEDMRLLRHILWVHTSNIPTVDRLVMELANPLDNEARQLIDEVEALAAEVTNLLKSTDNMVQRRRKGVQVNSKMNRLGKDLATLQQKAKSSSKRSTMITEARTRLQSLVKSLLTELYGVDVEPDAAS